MFWTRDLTLPRVFQPLLQQLLSVDSGDAQLRGAIPDRNSSNAYIYLF